MVEDNGNMENEQSDVSHIYYPGDPVLMNITFQFDNRYPIANLAFGELVGEEHGSRMQFQGEVRPQPNVAGEPQISIAFQGQIPPLAPLDRYNWSSIRIRTSDGRYANMPTPDEMYISVAAQTFERRNQARLTGWGFIHD